MRFARNKISIIVLVSAVHIYQVLANTFPRIDDQSQLEARISNLDRLSTDERERIIAAINDPSTKADSTIRQVIFIHRHGDRTPIEISPKDNLKREPFWYLHGLGGLTNRGKERLFLMGKLTRARYANLFENNSVNKNQRISRSSGAMRCLESGALFLAGLLDLHSPDSKDAHMFRWGDPTYARLGQLWQPIGITSVPSSIDGMMIVNTNCNRLKEEINNVIGESDVQQNLFSEFSNEAEVLKSTLGVELNRSIEWFWAESDLEVERSYFPDKFQKELTKIYDRLEKAGSISIGAYQQTKTVLRFGGGLLMNDMIRHMSRFQNLTSNYGKNAFGLKKFIHYSTHDTKLVVLLGMLDSWQVYPKQPGFTANIAIELHQDGIEWFLKFFYMPEVPGNRIELQVNDCNPSGRCTLEKFKSFVEPYLIESWQQWMSECGTDLSKVDPYGFIN